MAISIKPDVPSLAPQPPKVTGERARTRSTERASSVPANSETAESARPTSSSGTPSAASPDSVSVSHQAQQRTGAPVGDRPPEVAVEQAPGRVSGISTPAVAAERAALASAMIAQQPRTAALAHANLVSYDVLKLLAA
jgi:hypothetical protein